MARKPTLTSQTVAPGISGTPVDLHAMADEQLAQDRQQAVTQQQQQQQQQQDEAAPNYVPSDQYLAETEEPQSQAVVRGADRPYAPENSVQLLRQQVKERLGISRVAPLDVNVGDFRFTMVKVSDSDAEWAYSHMDENSAHRGAALSSFKTAIVAISVRAINGIPIYKFVGLELPRDSKDVEMVIEKPLYPPVSIRFAAADAFLTMLQEEMDDLITPALYNIYNTNIEEKYAIKVALDAPLSNEPSEKTEQTQS